MLYSCYYYRDSKRYCNCEIGYNDLDSDSIQLDSIKLFYMNIHSMPGTSLNSDSEVVNFAISVKHVKTSTDGKILKKMDSTIRNLDVIRDVIFNQNLNCRKSRKRTYMQITDVYILYYKLRGVRKEIYISYYKNTVPLNDKLFYLMGSPINRYKCPLVLMSLVSVFH